jgi:hypothetical protein
MVLYLFLSGVFRPAGRKTPDNSEIRVLALRAKKILNSSENSCSRPAGKKDTQLKGCGNSWPE